LNGNGWTVTSRHEPREQETDYDLVGQYLSQIAATPLLMAAEEVELAKQIEAGVFARELLRRADDGKQKLPASRDELETLVRIGEQAKDRMIRANLRLVVAAARKYYRSVGSFLDVVQDGNLGLIRAVEKFDYTKGFKFSTYAMWWIRQAIERGRADKARAVRLPVHVVEEIARLGRAERKIQMRLGREPTVDEVAAEAGLTADRVTELRNLSREAVSLDAPVREDGSTRVSDLIEDTDVLTPPEVVEFRGLAEELRAIVDTLPPREATIITLRYGLHDGRQHSLREVADRLELSPERVRQLEHQALTELRDPERQQPLLAWAS
jgi:RNA polymerase sigma factor (sigma-70 family)